MVVYIPDNASFTGADIKAMVYMPVNTTSIKNEIAELHEQMSDIHEELRRTRSLPNLSATELTRNEGRVYAAQALGLKIQELYELSKSSASAVALTLAELSTISYSIHREAFPVRSLGSVYAKDYTRGPRTIAGSLVFTVFNRHVLTHLLETTRAVVSTGILSQPDEYNSVSPVLPDQIPPFDIIIKYSNELGENSGMIIYGVQIINEGQTTSINDMITENQMQFVARDIDIMRDISTRNLVRNIGVGKAKTPRDLAEEDDAFQRLKRRSNPFI